MHRATGRAEPVEAGRGATLVALVLALAACTPRTPVPPELKADPARLLEEVRAAQAHTERVEGMAKVKLESPDTKGSVSAFIAAERPANIHIELLDFFGNPVVVLVASGDRFGFYDARKKTWYRGDATAENVSRFLPIALPPWELATILRGSAPILAGTPTDVIDRPHARVDLVISGDGLVQTLGIADELAVSSSRLRRTGDANGVSSHYDLTFDDFSHKGGVLFPLTVRLDSPRASARVQVAWRPDLEVNGPSRPELFRLEPPAGARIVDLPPGGAVPEVDIPLGTEE